MAISATELSPSDLLIVDERLEVSIGNVITVFRFLDSSPLAFVIRAERILYVGGQRARIFGPYEILSGERTERPPTVEAHPNAQRMEYWRLTNMSNDTRTTSRFLPFFSKSKSTGAYVAWFEIDVCGFVHTGG